MRYDFLHEPISEAEPCGPDLEESFDQQYVLWTSEASGLVPERYYTPLMSGGGVTVFDRSSIDYAEQDRRIMALLQRSRDLRLVTLDARFQLLEGDLEGFAEALEGARILTVEFWDQVHPLPFDGTDFVMRVNALEALNDNLLLIPALHAVPLIKGRSQISYRNVLVATDALTPIAGEEVMSRDSIARTMKPAERSPEAEPTRKQLTAVRDTAVACLAALGAIRAAFIEKAGHASAPAFVVQQPGGRVRGIEPALKAIVDYLNGFLAEAVLATGELATDDGGMGESQPVLGVVQSHGAASAALAAVESYFFRIEPSSPALILIHQARLLVGRPLIEALETLLPEPATRATMRFEAGYPFSLDLTRMKLVTDSLLANRSASAGDEAQSNSDNLAAEAAFSEDPAPDQASEEVESLAGDAGEPDAEDGPASVATPAALLPAGPTLDFAVATRPEAAHLLNAVESFFRQVEPSSPIPTLLVRARGYFGKDFSAILNEIMPPDQASGSE